MVELGRQGRVFQRKLGCFGQIAEGGVLRDKSKTATVIPAHAFYGLPAFALGGLPRGAPTTGGSGPGGGG